jgi:alpha-galactosidase
MREVIVGVKGETFTSLEAVLVYSSEGIGQMTRTFHDLYRKHLIRGEYKDKMLTILINNWEATYFDFDSEKLLSIAGEASKLGIKMLVIDDGWFGARKDDNSALGDWVVNVRIGRSRYQVVSEHLVEVCTKRGFLV